MTSLRELKSPIRIYWDVSPLPAASAPDHRRICGEIVRNKVLSLQVSESAPALGSACFAILDALKDKTIALSLVASRSAAIAAAPGDLRRLPLKALLITVASKSELEPVLDVQRRLAGKTPVGVSFPVTGKNCRELPEVLAWCINHGLPHLVFPMQRLMNDEECYLIAHDERKELAAQIGEIDKPAWLKPVIHDPFLWRVFYPSKAFPGGGCQAANTMLYISPEADVYPCPSLPIKLGSLIRESLGEILQSDRKKDLRKRLVSPPRECVDCDELEQCRGGCRGRSYRTRSSVQRSDPACRGSSVQ